MMAITIPIIFAYYFGTISSWIGYVYDMEPIIGGLSLRRCRPDLKSISKPTRRLVTFRIGGRLSPNPELRMFKETKPERVAETNVRLSPNCSPSALTGDNMDVYL
jgi:hypothetical protein